MVVDIILIVGRGGVHCLPSGRLLVRIPQ